MKRSEGTIIIILIFIFLVSYLAVNFFLKESVQMVKWEYQIVGIEDLKFESDMQKLGNAGWELASARRAVSGGEDIYEVILKRPKIGN